MSEPPSPDRVEFELTADDFRALGKASPLPWWTWPFHAEMAAEAMLDSAAFLVGVTGNLCVAAGVTLLIAAWVARQIYLSPTFTAGNFGWEGRLLLELTSQGFIFTSLHHRLRVRWGKELPIQRLKGHFVFSGGGYQIPTPVRAFPNPAAAEAFFDLANRLHEQSTGVSEGWAEFQPPDGALQVTYSNDAAELMENPKTGQWTSCSTRVRLLAAAIAGLAIALRWGWSWGAGLILLAIFGVWLTHLVSQFCVRSAQLALKPLGSETASASLAVAPECLSGWRKGDYDWRVGWEKTGYASVTSRFVFLNRQGSKLVIPIRYFENEAAARRFAAEAGRWYKVARDRVSETTA